MMKRCLFVCLFVCLVNVANADYVVWLPDGPAGVADDAWTTVTFTIGASGSFDSTDSRVSWDDIKVGDNFEHGIAYYEAIIDLSGLFASNVTSYYLKVSDVEGTAANVGIEDSIAKFGYGSYETPYLYVWFDDGIGFEDDRIHRTKLINVNYMKTGGSFKISVATPAPGATPEPATLAVFGLGLAGLGLCRRMWKI